MTLEEQYERYLRDHRYKQNYYNFSREEKTFEQFLQGRIKTLQSTIKGKEQEIQKLVKWLQEEVEIATCPHCEGYWNVNTEYRECPCCPVCQADEEDPDFDKACRECRAELAAGHPSLSAAERNA